MVKNAGNIQESTIWKTINFPDGSQERIFRGDQLFEWHRDYEHRIVTVLDCIGLWQFQLDDNLPQQLSIGSKIDIRRDVWHRIISDHDSQSMLRVKIDFP